MLDTNKQFPIRQFTQTDAYTKKISIFYTRSASYNGRIWSDADINYYEALQKIQSRYEYVMDKELADAIEELIDETIEVV
jgi:hypothetical protein